MSKANDNLTISPAGLALIKKWEGWYPKAYKDPVGVWTIGWGTTGAEARPGRTITKKQGEEFLRGDLKNDEETVKRLVKVPLNQYEFDSLVSFVYNVGSGNLARSTLLKLLNRGNKQAAAGQFIRWNKARSRETNEWLTLDGLTNRRKDEAALFLRDPTDDFKIEDLNMESQKPLENPQDHEATVSTEAPTEHPAPWTEVIKNTDTFKGVTSAVTGVLVALTQLFDPIKDNPVAASGLAVALAAMIYVLFIKKRDTQEGR